MEQSDKLFIYLFDKQHIVVVVPSKNTLLLLLLFIYLLYI